MARTLREKGLLSRGIRTGSRQGLGFYCRGPPHPHPASLFLALLSMSLLVPTKEEEKFDTHILYSFVLCWEPVSYHDYLPG